MSNAAKIYTLVVLLLGSAAALVVTGNAASGTQAAAETVIYKDPNGKWPDGSYGPTRRLERAEAQPYSWQYGLHRDGDRWI